MATVWLAGHTSLRKFVNGDVVYHAPVASDSECRQVFGIFY